MSAILQAITELRHRRELIDDAIGLLRRIQLDGSAVEVSEALPKLDAPPESGPDESPSVGTVAQVARVLRQASAPMAKREIREATGLTSSQMDHAITRLVKAGAVIGDGATNKRRYSVSDDFDVVWDGASDRNGTAKFRLTR